MKKDRQKGIRGEASSHQSRATDPPKQRFRPLRLKQSISGCTKCLVRFSRRRPTKKGNGQMFSSDLFCVHPTAILRPVASIIFERFFSVGHTFDIPPQFLCSDGKELRVLTSKLKSNSVRTSRNSADSSIECSSFVCHPIFIKQI